MTYVYSTRRQHFNAGIFNLPGLQSLTWLRGAIQCIDVPDVSVDTLKGTEKKGLSLDHREYTWKTLVNFSVLQGLWITYDIFL